MVIKSSLPDLVIPDTDVASFVLTKLKRWGNKLAIIDTGNNCKEYTYDDVRKNAMKCGSAFYRMGLKKGDVVATCLTNCAEFVFIAIGANACGGILTAVNPVCTQEEMIQRLNQVQPRIVFANSFNYQTLQKVCDKLSCVKKLFCIEEGKGETFSEFISNGESKDFTTGIEINSEDTAMIFFTSGTTGLPKGVMWSHRNVLASFTLARCGSLRLNADDVSYMIIPMLHVSSGLGCFLTLMQGATLVLKKKFDFTEMLQDVQKFKITYANVVPQMLVGLNQLSSDNGFNLSSLRQLISGGSHLSLNAATSVIKKYKVDIAQVWGMTEGLPASHQPDLNIGVGSVGSLVANTQLKVVDVTNGKELGPNKDGELCLKGPQFMKGYWKNPEATARTIDSEGWLHTGDIGHYDENEFIYIVDRLTSLITYKGFQISPAELEDVLLRHPKIVDVGVIGVPDLKAGELPKAYVVKKDPTLTEKEIHDFLQDKVADFKYLRGGITFIDAIPKTLIGKTLHRALKELEKK